MKYSFVFNGIYKSVLLVSMLAVLAACSTSMDVVQKNLEEGRFVPKQALENIDFLNEYSHDLPAPKGRAVDIDIAFERRAVLATGESVVVQIALTTSEPVLKARNLHVLAYNPDQMPAADLQAMMKAVATIKRYGKNLPKGSTLTIDWANRNKDLVENTNSLLPTGVGLDLVAFLRQYARLALEDKDRHFILLLGDQGDLFHYKKQDVVDLVRIFRAKSATLSTLALGDKPQISFIRKISANGNGLFNIINNNFDYDTWINNEVRYINSAPIADIKLSIQTQNGAVFEKILSPSSLSSSEMLLNHELSELRQGKDYLIVAKLKTPLWHKSKHINVVKVDVEYFDKAHNRFHSFTKYGGVKFNLSRSESWRKKNTKVVRSLLILKTQKTLQDIPEVIRNKRYYQAIALLEQHRINLAKFDRQHNDEDLLRDAEILKTYSERLYHFDEKIFQSFKIWRDFRWDAGRFSESFQ